jgi:ADP-heptose:LPS heptosyltransferase
MPLRRILLIRLHHLGDVLLTTPAIRALRDTFPDATIDFVTRGAAVDLLAGNSALDSVLPYGAGVRGEVGILREVRQRGYDAVVDFHSTPRSARLAWASRAPVRVAVRGRGPRNRLYTHLGPSGHGRTTYMPLRFLELLEPLGVPRATHPDLSLDATIGEEDRAWAAREWVRLGLPEEGPVVALSAVARDPRKQWGVARWAAVADAIAEAGIPILLTHGPGEEEQERAVAEAMRHAPVRGHAPTTVRQLAALFARCALWLGNDGGPKHLAVAAGVPTVSVIRSGEATVWTDPSPGSPHRFVEGPVPTPDHRGGIDAVTAEQVLAVAESALRAALASRTG